LSSQESVFSNIFVVIGAMKCGTTSLHDYLGYHPDIYMSRTKELDFFVEEGNWRRGVAWYEKQFDRSGRIQGESSPNYSKFHYFRGVPERMHGVIPEAKLVYLVRDPVERLTSHYLHNVAAGRERGTLESAFSDGLSNNHYALTSSYFRQLEQFLRYYPEERVLIVSSERLRSERRATLRVIFGFLGVDPEYDDVRFDAVRHDSSKKRRPTAFSRRLYVLPGGRYLRYGLRNFLDTELEKPKLNGSVGDRIREFLAEDVARLRSFTGQPFAEWSL